MGLEYYDDFEDQLRELLLTTLVEELDSINLYIDDDITEVLEILLNKIREKAEEADSFNGESLDEIF